MQVLHNNPNEGTPTDIDVNPSRLKEQPDLCGSVGVTFPKNGGKSFFLSEAVFCNEAKEERVGFY